MSKEAEKLAAEIVSYLFDDYPGNDQVRRDAVQEVARRTTTALTAARAKQREVDAKIAEQFSMLSWVGGSTGSAKGTADNIAKAIRAGKE